ncbi:hypothetical protein JCM10449v2_000687 [Rhodotorula kratochvilovae]
MSYPSAPSSSSSGYPSAPSTSYSSYEPVPPQYHSYAHDAGPPSDLHPHRQPPPPAPSTSSLTPSSNFGSFAVRRVRSSGTLPHLHPSALHPHAAYAQPVYPPSPVSPLYPGGLAAQQTSAPAGWRDGGYPQSLDAAQFAYADEPYYSARPPQTPPPSARKRVASAQPSFATQTPATRPATSAYTSYPGSAFGVPEAAPMSYSHTTPGGGFPQTSPEEVNQFFQEMSEILGPEALAALSPTSSYAPPPSLAPPPPTVTLQPPLPSKKRATYNVSGVLLDEDDYRAFADSPTTSRQPSPAQAQPFVPLGMIYGAPSDPALPTNGYLAPSQLGVPIDLQRPVSAPPTPAAGEPEPMFRFAPYGSPYDTPSSSSARATAPMNRRRGSSLDASAIPRMYSSGLVGFAPPPPPHEAPYAPAAGMSPTRPPPVQIHRAHAAPPMSAYPPSFRVGPSQPQQQRRRSPPPSPTRPRTQAPPQTPKRAPGGRRSKGSSISFINFSAADSKTLLGGVAPSGSSKKRAREGEGDEGREEKRVAVE